MKTENTILKVDNLSKAFAVKHNHNVRYALQDIAREFIGKKSGRKDLRRDEFWVLKDINFELKTGTSMGIIGGNGSGKSTLLNILMGVYKPTEGSVKWRTNNIVLIDQHTALNPRLTGRENIVNKLTSMGEDKAAIKNKIDNIIAFSGIDKFIDTPFSNYSSGMKLRLVFSIYAHCWPDVFIIDEALEVGDIEFSNRFSTFIQHYVNEGGTMLLVSHRAWLIRRFCQQCLLINNHKMEAIGDTDEIMPLYHQLMEVDSSSEAESESNLDNTKTNADENKQSDVIIQSITVKPLNSKELLPGGQLEIEVNYHSKKEFSNVGISLTILKNNICVSNITTTNPFYQWAINEGKNCFKCVVKHLPLIPGQYQLMGGLVIEENEISRDIATFGVNEAPVYINIEGKNLPHFQRGKDIECTTYIDAEWDNEVKK